MVALERRAERDGVSSWRAKDLCRIVEMRFGVTYRYGPASGDLRHDQVYNERVWAKAIHRVATERISPAQAVDDAIARVKQILSQ